MEIRDHFLRGLICIGKYYPLESQAIFETPFQQITEPSRRPPRIVCLGQTWRSLQMKSQIVCSNNLASQPPSHIIHSHWSSHIPRDRVQLTAPYKILWEFNFYLIDGKLFEENRAEINKTKCNSMANVMVPFIYNWMNSSPTRQSADEPSSAADDGQ